MLDIRDVQLYVEERGTGTPILGIHGTPSSALLWAEAASVLAGIGRCITCGDSAKLSGQSPMLQRYIAVMAG